MVPAPQRTNHHLSAFANDSLRQSENSKPVSRSRYSDEVVKRTQPFACLIGSLDWEEFDYLWGVGDGSAHYFSGIESQTVQTFPSPSFPQELRGIRTSQEPNWLDTSGR
jgi:hypothetical protein